MHSFKWCAIRLSTGLKYGLDLHLCQLWCINISNLKMSPFKWNQCPNTLLFTHIHFYIVKWADIVPAVMNIYIFSYKTKIPSFGEGLRCTFCRLIYTYSYNEQLCVWTRHLMHWNYSEIHLPANKASLGYNKTKEKRKNTFCVLWSEAFEVTKWHSDSIGRLCSFISLSFLHQLTNV